MSKFIAVLDGNTMMLECLAEPSAWHLKWEKITGVQIIDSKYGKIKCLLLDVWGF